jgi:hypothetical protein
MAVSPGDYKRGKEVLPARESGDSPVRAPDRAKRAASALLVVGEFEDLVTLFGEFRIDVRAIVRA